MRSYAPQNVIDGAAFLLASPIALDDWSKEEINQFVVGSGNDYRRYYRDDNWFEDDVMHCAQYAEEVARRAYADRTLPAELYAVVMDS
jgi:hypothetical protein